MTNTFESLLKQAHITKAELSRRLGVSARTVSTWGENAPQYALSYLGLLVGRGQMDDALQLNSAMKHIGGPLDRQEIKTVGFPTTSCIVLNQGNSAVTHEYRRLRVTNPTGIGPVPEKYFFVYRDLTDEAAVEEIGKYPEFYWQHSAYDNT